MRGSTSSFKPTSTYCTFSEMPTFAVDVVVIIGTLSPTKILAFSLFLTRILGLDNKLTSPLIFLKLTAGFGDTSKRLLLFLNKPSNVNCVAVFTVELAAIPAPDVTVVIGIKLFKATRLGYSMPSSCKRLRLTSNTSISSITSGSSKSLAATNFSAILITSGVSRITSILSLSSTNMSLVLSIDFNKTAACLALVLVK